MWNDSVSPGEMKAFFITGTILLFFLQVSSQNLHQSIHAEQQDFYNQFGDRESGFYDSLNGFAGKMTSKQGTEYQLFHQHGLTAEPYR